MCNLCTRDYTLSPIPILLKQFYLIFVSLFYNIFIGIIQVLYGYTGIISRFNDIIPVSEAFSCYCDNRIKSKNTSVLPVFVIIDSISGLN